MHINVRDFRTESVGYSQAYKITGERPSLETVRLTKDIEGEITISLLDSNLLVRGRISTEIEVECHRCLSTFTRPVQVSFQQLFAEAPSDEEMPVVDDTIDLAPLVEQEIILSLPIKILCRPDCQGIENAAGRYTRDEAPSRLQDRATIKKGSKRGRTQETHNP